MNSAQLFCTHLIRRDETIKIDEIHFPFPPVVQTALTPRCCGCKFIKYLRSGFHCSYDYVYFVAMEIIKTCMLRIAIIIDSASSLCSQW